MASLKSYSFQAAILLVLLLITPSFARLSVKVTKDVIKDICSKTLNHSFCLQFLSSNPEVGKLDIKGIARITIDSARSNSTNTLKLISSLTPKTTDPALKQGYADCAEQYANAIDDLEDAEKSLRTDDPNGVNIKTSAAMTEADDCVDGLKGLPADLSVLKGSQDLNNICDIVLVISNLLPQ